MINLPYFFRRIAHRLNGRVVHLKPQSKPRGNVLISYTTLPYLDRRQIVLDAHTNRWECMQIARTFLERGYAVDIIDHDNMRFVPKKNYAYFVGAHTNFDHIAPLLNPDCIKIFHGATCHWKFLNDAEQARLDAIEEKRGVRLAPVRALGPNHAIELCDVAIMLGNDATLSTYPKVNKRIEHIPLSTTHTYPSPKDRDFEKVRENFIWFGGAGLAHKGVDLVLEAFASMPEYTLTLVRKIDPADPVVQAYEREMYELPNIKTIGWLDPGSVQFKDICAESLGLVYPSCSEGCAGSVVLFMHAGLIPIVSRESGVDTGSFGVTLRENSAEAIREIIRTLATASASELKKRVVDSWSYACANHTRDRFAQVFGEFVDTLERSKK